jgi:hypothetical protein
VFDPEARRSGNLSVQGPEFDRHPDHGPGEGQPMPLEARREVGRPAVRTDPPHSRHAAPRDAGLDAGQRRLHTILGQPDVRDAVEHRQWDP